MLCVVEKKNEIVRLTHDDRNVCDVTTVSSDQVSRDENLISLSLSDENVEREFVTFIS